MFDRQAALEKRPIYQSLVILLDWTEHPPVPPPSLQASIWHIRSISSAAPLNPRGPRTSKIHFTLKNNHRELVTSVGLGNNSRDSQLWGFFGRQSQALLSLMPSSQQQFLSSNSNPAEAKSWNGGTHRYPRRADQHRC